MSFLLLPPPSGRLLPMSKNVNVQLIIKPDNETFIEIRGVGSKKSKTCGAHDHDWETLD